MGVEKQRPRIPGLRKIGALRQRLLDWYTSNKRDLPWRKSRDPYAIWVSEIMLQQTRVAAVTERYVAFMERFPTIEALALAAEEDVLALWSGLGYYRRARMLHEAARVVAAKFGGKLPATAAELRELPGIGTYTAAAIASIAHGERVAVVDGNVERVLCRLEEWEADGSTALKRRIEALAAELVDPARPGDFNQAMMELGAVVCAPRHPLCRECPLFDGCRTRGEHKTAARAPMVSREIGHALSMRRGREVVLSASGVEVLLERRPDDVTVMAGMWELPALRDAKFPEEHLRVTVRHAIMQVNYSVRIRNVPEEKVEGLTLIGGERRWVALDVAEGMALTGLTRKVLTRAQLLPGAGVARQTDEA